MDSARPQLSLAEPFTIATVAVPNRVVLAPMAGLTSSAYRRHMKGHGAGLVITEMVSAQGLLHHNLRTGEYLDFAESERPIAVQLFGDSPDVMARAAETVLAGAQVPDLLDINMGCPVRKVVKTGAGSALLGDPTRAAAVAGAVVRVASQLGVPVTVKLRAGLRPGDGLGLDLAPRLEAAGVAALGVHPRAAGVYYHGAADHSVTAAISAAVGIPVMASGDIDSIRAAANIVEATGVAAVMVARGATGNPWLIEALLAGEERVRPPLPEVVADLRALLALVAAERGEERAARWIRKMLTSYLRPSRVPAPVIEPIRALVTAREVDTALAALVA
jgi:tRNA-dihydrouridine synthase B